MTHTMAVIGSGILAAVPIGVLGPWLAYKLDMNLDHALYMRILGILHLALVMVAMSLAERLL